MTTSNDAKTQPSSDKSKAETLLHKEQQEPSNNIIPNTRGKRGNTFIYALVALIALGCAFYTTYVNVQLRHGILQQEERLNAKMNWLKQQHTVNVTEVTGTIKAINDSQAKLHDKISSLDQNLHSTLQQHAYQKNDWLLLKARYYLELAQINAHWSDNAQTTSALLQEADVLLASMHDQHLFNIRQALAKEIADINTLPKLDIAGLLSQLDAAQKNVTHLPMRYTQTHLDKTKATLSPQKVPSTWQENLKESLSQFKELVIIRHHEDDFLPLPSQEFESMLRESIHLSLQEAQWAILQNNDTVYQFSLKQAINNINRSFEQGATTQALIQQLQRLQQIQLTQPKPALEQSLRLLNEWIESKGSQDSMPQAATSGENS